MPRISSDHLTAVATLMAAVAAFASFGAALWQERATFTSALYGKQVDVSASLGSTVQSYVSGIGKWRTDSLSTTANHATASAANSPETGRSLAELEDAWDAAYEAALLIFLTPIRGQLSAIHKELEEYRSRSGNLVQAARQHQPPPSQTDLAALNSLKSRVLGDVSVLQRCFSGQLSTGHYLNSDAFLTCFGHGSDARQ